MSLMGMNPLADVSDARIIGPPRSRGQRFSPRDTRPTEWGAMTFILGKLVWAVAQPGNLLLLCLVAGVFLLLRGRRRGEALVVLSAIGFLLLAVAPIGPALMLVLNSGFRGHPSCRNGSTGFWCSAVPSIPGFRSLTARRCSTARSPGCSPAWH